MDIKFVRSNFFLNSDLELGRADGRVVSHTVSNGYSMFRFKGEKLYVHRVVFLLSYGFVPEFVDHIDGDRGNNLPSNLRAASLSQNNSNSKLKSNNTSGFKGVTLSKKSGKFIAKIMSMGKLYYIGEFDDAEVAAEEYDNAAVKHHGRFAKTNKMLGLLP